MLVSKNEFNQQLFNNLENVESIEIGRKLFKFCWPPLFLKMGRKIDNLRVSWNTPNLKERFSLDQEKLILQYEIEAQVNIFRPSVYIMCFQIKMLSSKTIYTTNK